MFCLVGKGLAEMGRGVVLLKVVLPARVCVFLFCVESDEIGMRIWDLGSSWFGSGVKISSRVGR